MSTFSYVLISIIIVLLAVLIFGILYVLYTKKINRVLKNQEKPGNYGSLDGRFFKVVIFCLVLFVALFALSYEKVYKYEIPFYEDITDIDFEKFGTDLENIIKPEDGYIALEQGIKIFTDPDGKIEDISIPLIVKKENKYCHFVGKYSDEKNTITYRKANLIDDHIFPSHIPLSKYKEVFSRIDFSNIWNMTDIEKPNYFDLEFWMELEEGVFDPNFTGPAKIIDANGDVREYDSFVSGLLGRFTIWKKREYLDGSLSLDKLDRFLLIP